RAAPGSRRVRRVLRHRRGAGQRREAQRSALCLGTNLPVRRGALDDRRRRRARRCRPGPRHWSSRDRTTPGCLRRHGAGLEPLRWAHRREHGAAVRAVIAEDLALLRDGLVRLLAAHDIEVVAAVDDGPSVVETLVDHRPDIAVLDVRLPPTFTNEGLRAAIEARTQLPGLPIVVLSQYVEPLYARELLSGKRGGVGYLLKD